MSENQANMSALIKNLQIKNFKSVRDLALECDRINIFIGKPNAGKSNILEAISLLGAGYSTGKFMEGFVRYKSIVQLFSNFNFHIPILVTADEFTVRLKSSEPAGIFNFLTGYSSIEKMQENQINRPEFILPDMDINITLNGVIDGKSSRSPNSIKKYDFRVIGNYQERSLFLHPPHGDNFYLIVRTNSALREEIQAFLRPNGLELLLDEESQRIVVVQKENGALLSFPMHLVPDTFQRYIFHLAAIMSNRDSVLLFEEPESHSYGPYIYQLAQHILNDEGGNQYFITTHSPYFLLPLMQEGKDVAVFATWFEDYQTHVKRLTEVEIREMLDYGVDVFLNLDDFIPA